MGIDELSDELNGLSVKPCEDAGHQERGHLTRKSSTSSTSSIFDKRKLYNRNNSEVKIEAIFKELFSPDAKIIDHFEGDVVEIPDLQSNEVEKKEVIPNHDRFKLRRQTSLIPKDEPIKKKLSTSFQPRNRAMPAKKSPAPIRKTSNPTQRKRSTSAKPQLPKLSAPPDLKPNFVTLPVDPSSSYLRKNPIPLRRGITQK